MAEEAVAARPGPRADEFAHFGLLARAVAGRSVGVVGGAGERSYTDGESIFLADASGSQRFASVSAQAALLAAGSLEPNVMVRIAGRRAVRLRYLTLEAQRAAVVLAGTLPRWLERMLADLYDGGLTSSPHESLAWALDARRRVPEAPVWVGTIKPIIVLRAGPAPAGAPPIEQDRLGEPLAEQLRDLDDEEESERSRILELLSAPIRSPLAAMVQRFFDMGRTPSAGGAGEELPVGGHRFGPVGPNAKSAEAPASMTLGLSATPIGHRYPEWDFRARAYRHDHCAVAEFDPPEFDTTAAESSVARIRDVKLRRQLARLGLSHERHRREPDGDVLDVTALIELVVDRAAGRPGDPRVYESKRRTAHDLGVLVLLDATGSTGESAEGRRVFDEQRLLCGRLTAALEELGDRVAAYGFYSRGREAVRFLRVKDFDDRFDLAAERRLGSLAPGGYTRLGAAIRHGSAVVSTRAGTSQQLLVLVGDGLPYEDGYEHRYAQEDCRRALQEAVARGVGCACLSVRSRTPEDVLERVWGEVPHRRLEDASELAGEVRPLFAAALKLAAASRRPTGRLPSPDAPRRRRRR